MLKTSAPFTTTQNLSLIKPHLKEPTLEQIHQIPIGTIHSFNRRSFLPTHESQYWLLKSGIVRTITYQEDGRVFAFGIWSEGDIFGLPLSTLNPYLVETLTPVEVISITTSEWQPSMKRSWRCGPIGGQKWSC
jgi:hypothetical protein